jgi:hypothetical protein
MKGLLLTSLIAISSFSVHAQAPPPPPAPPASSYAVLDKSLGSNSAFGNYYRIEKYPVLVPFHEAPHISAPADNDLFKLSSYSYAYPYEKDDINILYGIDVYEFKNDNQDKDMDAKINLLAHNIRLTFEDKFSGKLISEEKKGSASAYTYRQKMKVNYPEDKTDAYMTSYFRSYKGMVIRLFVITAKPEDNKRISDFFESIKLE